LLLAACTAGNGEGLDESGQPIPINPPANSDFQEIQDTVFTPICTQCHIGAGAPQGLRLDAANSYAMLVNVASNEVGSLLRVNPGNPDQSYIVQKIQGTAAVGGRMPLGQAQLPQDRIDLIRGWIAAGAPAPAAVANKLTVASSCVQACRPRYFGGPGREPPGQPLRDAQSFTVRAPGRCRDPIRRGIDRLRDRNHC